MDSQIHSAPPSNLGVVIVIPCFNEPALPVAFNSLWNCERPSCAVEVITIINASDADPPGVHRQNQVTFDQASRWIAEHRDPRLTFHLLPLQLLPAKHAGVGLARKIGMDEAARRADAIGNPTTIIACFDADCQCDPNYLVALETHFRAHPDCPGCSIYFEHPVRPSGDLPYALATAHNGHLPAESVYPAITAYELHLRYYVQALRFAGFPYAYHTVGSSMAVASWAYKNQGGMNKRKAGEDFYFLHKIIPIDGFRDLTATRVVPSPRVSDRVPFGTGRAVSEFIQRGTLTTYPLAAVDSLKECFERIDALFDASYDPMLWLRALPQSLAAFLETHPFTAAVSELRMHSASLPSFRKRFFQWFNAFRIMKYVHFARDRFYGACHLETAARDLLARIVGEKPSALPSDTTELLEAYRRLDRGLATAEWQISDCGPWTGRANSALVRINQALNP